MLESEDNSFLPSKKALLTFSTLLFQVIIGSPELKANQSIRQVIEILTDFEKYNRFVSKVVK